MSSFPELLYQLSARDQQVTWLDPIFDDGELIAAAAGVTADIFTVPLGRALILLNASMQCVPGAGQNVVRQRIQIGDPPNSFGTRIKQDNAAGAANAVTSLDWVGEIIVPENRVVRANGTFNAGVANNQVTGWIVGMLIPIGNVQRI